MNTDYQQINVSDISVNLVRKDIKNIHLAVCPPVGWVRVAAPLMTSEETVRMLIIARIPWIKKQKTKFKDQERQGEREYVSGESHYFFGKRYRLNVIQEAAAQRVDIKRNTFIDLHIKPSSDTKKREEIMDAFYRVELRKALNPILEKWQKATDIKVHDIQIKKMKTRWGTCKPERGRVWLNLELAKKPVRCLEYVLVHEMTHLKEKHHTERFVKLLDSVMPHWRENKDELNRSPLSHCGWTY